MSEIQFTIFCLSSIPTLYLPEFQLHSSEEIESSSLLELHKSAFVSIFFFKLRFSLLSLAMEAGLESP